MLAEEIIIRLPRFHETPTLGRIKSALSYANMDTITFPWVQIAGSKGKGSVSTMLDSIFRQCGYKTGLFLSPHIHTIRERITIHNKPIESLFFNELYETLQQILPPHLFEELTFFETMTLLAVMAFQQSKIDIAFFETGLGGRLDATTAIPNPILSIITLIELEHTNKLGNTIEEIAKEKAGIIRPHTPVLMSKQSLEAALVIQEVAAQKNSKLYSLDHLTFVHRTSDFVKPFESFVLNSGITGNTYSNIECKPLGFHQINNATVAIVASELLTKNGFVVTEKNFRDALSSISIPCRFEIITNKQNMWILDGAHTFHSCNFVSKTVKERFPGQKIPVIFGCKHNKNAPSLLQPLLEIASSFLFTDIPEIHSYPLESLTRIVQDFHFSGSVQSYYSSESTSFLQLLEDKPVLITGSLILASYFRSILLPKF
ncbi:MAG: Mur ligase family protein [Caldisericia bacterium]|nr:Mur ligase family protein [Caldisericia bacterium]MDD4614463.1 Mur ligase family protein [Caldisericia bacterium]